MYEYPNIQCVNCGKDFQHYRDRDQDITIPMKKEQAQALCEIIHNYATMLDCVKKMSSMLFENISNIETHDALYKKVSHFPYLIPYLLGK
jgi:hemoglobin-like flavoprotein